MTPKRPKPEEGTECVRCLMKYSKDRSKRQIVRPHKWVIFDNEWYCSNACKRTPETIPPGMKCGFCDKKHDAPGVTEGSPEYTEQIRLSVNWFRESGNGLYYCSRACETRMRAWIDAINEMAVSVEEKNEVGKCGRCQAPCYEYLCYQSQLEGTDHVIYFCNPYCMKRMELQSPDFMQRIYDSHKRKFRNFMESEGIDPALLESEDPEAQAKVVELLTKVAERMDKESDAQKIEVTK